MLKLSWPMMAIGWIINLYQRSMASLERCLQIIREPAADADNVSSTSAPVESYSVAVENLSFTYPQSKKPALKDISFRLGEGQTLGITGPVGSG
jgi:ATP-binding cassette subfamily B protein